jgi:hypothetical protein
LPITSGMVSSGLGADAALQRRHALFKDRGGGIHDAPIWRSAVDFPRFP